MSKRYNYGNNRFLESFFSGIVRGYGWSQMVSPVKNCIGAQPGYLLGLAGAQFFLV